MLVSKEPERLDVPHESGEWIEIMKLSWKQLKAARKKQEQEQREVMKDFGPAFLRALTSSEDGEKKARSFLKNREYDESNFDTEVLLESAILSWSYKEKKDEKNEKDEEDERVGIKVNLENIELLDELTAIWLKQEIINLTRPPDEEEVKNSLPDSSAA